MNNRSSFNFGLVGIFGIVIAALVVIILALSCFTVVGTSKVAVITTFGRVTGTAQTGPHFKAPWQQYHTIDISEQTLTTEYSTATKDSQSVSQSVTVRWSVDPAYAADLYTRYLGAHEERLLKATLPESVKQGAASFSLSDYIPKRDALSDKMEFYTHQKLDGTGIVIKAVNVSNIDLPDAFEKAIADRQVANERKATALVNKETAKTQAETNEILSKSYSKPEFFKIEWLRAWEKNGSPMPQTLVIDSESAQTVFPLK